MKGLPTPFGGQWLVVGRQFFRRNGFDSPHTSTITLRQPKDKSGTFWALCSVVGSQWSVVSF
jgi:hypothetical protein